MDIANTILQCSALLYFVSMAGYLCYLFHQKDKIQKLSLVLVEAAVAAHLVSVVMVGVQAQGCPSIIWCRAFPWPAWLSASPFSTSSTGSI